MVKLLIFLFFLIFFFYAQNTPLQKELDQPLGSEDFLTPPFKIESEGDIEDGEKNGQWTYYYVKDGQRAMFAKVNYNLGLLDGEAISYYPTTTNRYSYKVYKNGIKEGVWKWWYSHKFLRSSITFKNGKQEGAFTYYHEPHYVKLLSNDNQEFKLNLTNIGNLILNKEGVPRLNGFFSNNKKSGLWTYYFQDGSMRTKEYLDDIIVNISEYSTNKNEILSSLTLSNGVIHGKKNTYINNFLNKTENYLNNSLNGYFILYYPNSKQEKRSGYYINNIRENTWLYYDKNGNKTKKENYVGGMLNGIVQTYYPNGNIRSLTEYKNNTRNGSHLFFSPEGYNQEIQNYSNDIIDNFYAFLSSNQAILEKGYYKLGKKIGIWNFYTENGTLIKKLDYKSGLGIPENISPENISPENISP